MAISIEVIVFILLMFITTRRIYDEYFFRVLPYIILFIFMALRFDYGDGVSYRAGFSYLHNGINENNIETGYVFLNKILPNFQMVVVITSLLYVFSFYLVFSRTLTYTQRSLALLIVVLHPYILMVDMSAIRQSIAIASILIGTYIANKYRKIYFIPFCVFASLFHRSSIALFPLFLLFNKRHFSKIAKLVILGATATLLVLPDQFFQIVESLLTLFNLDSKNYLSYLYYGTTNGALAVAGSFLSMLFLLLFGDAVEKDKAIYVKFSILAMVLEALQGKVQQMGRVSMFFLPFLPIALPLILKNDPQNLILDTRWGVFMLDKHFCWVVEICFLAVFIWKFVGFMTPQFAYSSILTAN